MALRQMIHEIEAEPDAGSDDELDTMPFVRPAAIAMAPFSALERRVIDLARRDPIASLFAPGRIERAVGWVLGTRPIGRALADARLETLRRAAVITRHRHHMPDPVAATLRDAGFTPDQIGRLEALAAGTA